MKIGVITYDTRHLKTEQVVERLAQSGQEMVFFILPFVERNRRDPLLNHRPEQTCAAHPRAIARKFDFTVYDIEKNTPLQEKCDVVLVTGAGILGSEIVNHNLVLNAHPGIIPRVRGYDAFKWAIHRGDPLGVTLHIIDEGVDEGKIIGIRQTNIYKGDTPEILARRHYENEIDMLARFEEYMHGSATFEALEPLEAKMRMPAEIEQEVLQRFPAYIEKWAA